MRFRKSIRIMKGVRVNFSKSGMSLTLVQKVLPLIWVVRVPI